MLSTVFCQSNIVFPLGIENCFVGEPLRTCSSCFPSNSCFPSWSMLHAWIITATVDMYRFSNSHATNQFVLNSPHSALKRSIQTRGCGSVVEPFVPFSTPQEKTKREFPFSSCIYSTFLPFIEFKDLIIFIYARASVWVCAQKNLRRLEGSDPQGWDLQAIVSCSMWVMGIELPLTTELSLQLLHSPTHITVDSCFIQ